MVKLAAKATFSLLDKFERKISGREAVGAGKEFNLFIFNADMDDNIKIAELIEKPGILIDLATKIGKPEIEKTRSCISWGYDGIYSCFIDNNYGFFIDSTNGFFIDKCYN